MAPYMTELTKIIILNIHFALFCLMKRDGVDRMLPLTKRDISEQDSGSCREIFWSFFS